MTQASTAKQGGMSGKKYKSSSVTSLTGLVGRGPAVGLGSFVLDPQLDHS